MSFVQCAYTCVCVRVCVCVLVLFDAYLSPSAYCLQAQQPELQEQSIAVGLLSPRYCSVQRGAPVRLGEQATRRRGRWSQELEPATKCVSYHISSPASSSPQTPRLQLVRTADRHVRYKYLTQSYIVLKCSTNVQ